MALGFGKSMETLRPLFMGVRPLFMVVFDAFYLACVTSSFFLSKNY